MKNLEVSRRLQSLRSLIDRATKSTSDVELRAHWAQYICVLCAGFLENSLRHVYTDYVTKCSNTRVASFACSRIAGIQNPKSGKFVEIARSFDSTWATSLESCLSDQGRKEAIDSIMATRHLVAHGKDTAITIVRIKEYLTKAVEVLEFIESQTGTK
jgi:hypothetical protein